MHERVASFGYSIFSSFLLFLSEFILSHSLFLRRSFSLSSPTALSMFAPSLPVSSLPLVLHLLTVPPSSSQQVLILPCQPSHTTIQSPSPLNLSGLSQAHHHFELACGSVCLLRRLSRRTHIFLVPSCSIHRILHQRGSTPYAGE